jgi:hypothetical protein
MKIYFEISHPSRTSIQYTVSGIADAPKRAMQDLSARYVIHDGVLYPVLPEVQ